MHLICILFIRKYGFHTECVPVPRKYKSIILRLSMHVHVFPRWLVIPFSLPSVCMYFPQYNTIVQKIKTIIHTISFLSCSSFKYHSF